jgi:hypothetical protein
MRMKWERKKRDCFKVWHPRSACRISNERNMTRQYTTFIVAIMIAATCFGYIMIRLNYQQINPLYPELNPICYLLALLGAHHFLYVSRIRVKLLTFRRLMSYIYGAPILDVSRSHTTTEHSR